MTFADDPVDAVIIGIGATGAVAAHILTAAGVRVLALEPGPRLDAGMMSNDEIRNDIDGWMSEPKAAGEIPTLRVSETGDAHPSFWPTLMVNGVGGTAIHYPGASFRLLPWNFRSRSAVVERYGAEVVPSDSTLDDWPLSDEDLEPYYEKVEHAIGVSGLDHVDPFAGPRAHGTSEELLKRLMHLH